MTPAEKQRFQGLQTTWCSYNLARELYGVTGPADPVIGTYRAWAVRFQPGTVTTGPHGIVRHGFETFLQHSRLVPRHVAALRLGMDDESFGRVFAKFVTMGLQLPDPYVSEPFLAEIHRQFPGLRFRVFGDRNDYCRRLHTAIRHDLQIKVAAVHCETSVELDEDPPDYAYDLDAITLRPIGVRYQVWLDLGKPMHLKPDACSLRFYCKERRTLQVRRFPGTEPGEQYPSGVLRKLGWRA